MHDLRPREESLKPSPTMKGLPDMCEKLAKTCVLNYLGGLWLSQQPFAISWDPVKQKRSFVCSISPVEWGTYSKRICVLGPALEDARLFQFIALNSMECLLHLHLLKSLYQRKDKYLNYPFFCWAGSDFESLDLTHSRISPVFPTMYCDWSTEEVLVKTFLSKVLLHFSKRSCGIKAVWFPLHLFPLIFPPCRQGLLHSLLSPMDAVPESGCCSRSGSVQVPVCQAAVAKSNAKCTQCSTKCSSYLSLGGHTTSHGRHTTCLLHPPAELTQPRRKLIILELSTPPLNGQRALFPYERWAGSTWVRQVLETWGQPCPRLSLQSNLSLHWMAASMEGRSSFHP